MTGKLTITVPIAIKNSLLLPNETFEYNGELGSEFDASTPFIYDIAFYNGIETVKPWETEKYIPLVIREWKSVKLEIENKFEKRDRGGATLPMKVGISLFLELLFWTNGQAVQLYPTIPLDKLPIKPVNIEERLQFILARPNLFHSYKQLAELMVEMEKLFVKSSIKRVKK